MVKAGFGDTQGKLHAYWIFRIRSDDHTVAEMEFIIAGEPQLLIRRALSETVAEPAISWNLSEINGKVPDGEETPLAAIKPDMVIPNVTVQHMIDRADFETYIFASNPPWTSRREITDCLDVASPDHRMFSIAYVANDGRHIVLVQAPTYNKMLGNFAKQGRLVYTSPNGFKVWGGGPHKWYSKILLTSAKFVIKDPPAEDRIGYVLESPAGTFPSLAVNGPLTDEELHSLIDSLVPAKQYLNQ
ncbi:hypothetical protein ES703_125386 [subsurface metagenome]